MPIFIIALRGELFLGTGKYIFNITEPMRIETGIG
jgi:hypothetical protein